MIKKILVANRGEIAMRIFRTCRVMNISTVAVYTHVDRGALHVRYAEEAYCISESPEDTSYLKPELILSIAKKTGAAIHPGYGFLSENADFARRCEEEGVMFIGPSADIISKMGIKTEARKIMREAGLPIVPGTETPVQGIDEVKKVANEVGYPIMLKALAGGGGKGMRLVRTEEEVETALRLSQSEAGTSFGNDAVYIEKYIENPHHIEVQIMGDKKYRLPFILFQVEHKIQYLRLHRNVKCRNRLICKNEIRLQHKRPCYCKPLELTARKVFRISCEQVLRKRYILHKLFYPRLVDLRLYLMHLCRFFKAKAYSLFRVKGSKRVLKDHLHS